jgi:hypothetical protein
MECLGYSHLEYPVLRTQRRRVESPTHVSSPSIDIPSLEPTGTHLIATSTILAFPPTPVLPLHDHRPPSTATGGTWPLIQNNYQGNYLNAAATNTAPDDLVNFSLSSDSTASTFLEAPDAFTSWYHTDFVLSTSPMLSYQEPPNDAPGVSLGQPSAVLPPQLPDSTSHSLVPHCAPGVSLELMTTGEASIDFQALFSPEISQKETHMHSNSTSQASSSCQGAIWLSPDTEYDDESSVTSDEGDPEGVKDLICPTLALDSNVPSNFLPFILQIRALLMFST